MSCVAIDMPWIEMNQKNGAKGKHKLRAKKWQANETADAIGVDVEIMSFTAEAFTDAPAAREASDRHGCVPTGLGRLDGHGCVPTGLGRLDRHGCVPTGLAESLGGVIWHVHVGAVSAAEWRRTSPEIYVLAARPAAQKMGEGPRILGGPGEGSGLGSNEAHASAGRAAGRGLLGELYGASRPGEQHRSHRHPP